MLIRWMFAVLVALSMSLFGVASAAPMQLDMANEYTPPTLPAEADGHFAELVKQKTGGKIEIVNQYGGALGIKSKAMIDACSTGAVPLVSFPLETASGVDQFFNVTNLPVMGQTLEEAGIMQKITRPHLTKLLAKVDMTPLYTTMWPPVGIWASEPILDISGWKGKKIRVNTTIATDLFKRAGAAPVPLSWGDVIPQLQAGAISAVHTSVAGGTLGLPLNIVPNFIDIGFYVTQQMAAINTDVLENLSPELKKAVLDAARETEVWAFNELGSRIKKETAALVAKGAKVIPASEIPMSYLEQFRAISQPTIDQWMARIGDAGRKVFEEYRKAVAK